MKRFLLSSLFISSLFVTSFLISTPYSFAETVHVSVPQGTSVPGCEVSNECFIPFRVLITVGDVVTWSNDDSAAHTVTAGSAVDGPSGVFDSSLFMAGTNFEHKFETAGEFPYFCIVHPWMNGVVLVGDTMAKNPAPAPKIDPSTGNVMKDKTQISLKHEISGGKIISVYPDTDANSLIINLETTDSGQLKATLPRDIIDSKLGDADDKFFVLVDGEEVTFEEIKTSKDRTITIRFPSGAEEIEIIGTFVIPEFGIFAVLILGVSIISILVISARSTLSFSPKL